MKVIFLELLRRTQPHLTGVLHLASRARPSAALNHWHAIANALGRGCMKAARIFASWVHWGALVCLAWPAFACGDDPDLSTVRSALQMGRASPSSTRMRSSKRPSTLALAIQKARSTRWMLACARS